MSKSAFRRRLMSLAAVLAFTAGPLSALSTQQAAAASVATWDKLAQCESTGDWSNVHHTSTTTYYGGLQFDAATWNAYGGQQYAPYANQASKVQQILIAEKVLAKQGQGAWPYCGPKVGLGSDHAVPYPASKPSIGVYRASDQTFYMADGSGSSVVGVSTFGNPGDVPLTAHWSSTGKDTVGVYRPSDQTFFLTSDNLNLYLQASFGVAGDVPLVGDWDNTGRPSIGVYRPSDQTFYLSSDNLTVKYAVKFGNPGWVPIVGNWGGTGKDTIGAYDPDTQTFYLSNSNTSGSADHVVKFGSPGDRPIKGDWDGSGRDKIGVYRPGTQEFFGAGYDTDQVIYGAKFGNPDDIPITGHWS
ncbi:M23 family metallopeptidase [Kitasatospora sp. Ki12]